MSKYKIALVSELKNNTELKKESWDNFFSYISRDKECVAFDWKDYSNGKVNRYITSGPNGREEINYGNLDLNSSDVIFVKQLGAIGDKKDRFFNFLDGLNGIEGRVANNPVTMRENLSKEYLLTLQEKGIGVIPTLKLLGNETLEDIKKNYFVGTNDYVVKPMVFGEKGVGVKRLSEFGNNSEFEQYMKGGTKIIQPFVSDILTDGEKSLIFLGKDFTHGVQKSTEDFKVNVGTKKRSFYNPTKEDLELCEKVFSAWESPIEYTRFDIIHDNGKPLISEVEMVNPSMYTDELKMGKEFFSKLESFLMGGVKK